MSTFKTPIAQHFVACSFCTWSGCYRYVAGHWLTRRSTHPQNVPLIHQYWKYSDPKDKSSTVIKHFIPFWLDNDSDGDHVPEEKDDELKYDDDDPLQSNLNAVCDLFCGIAPLDHSNVEIEECGVD